MIIVVLTIAIILLALGGALWAANRIMRDGEQTEGEEVQSKPSDVFYISRDAWEGFDKAHHHNPAKWAENDSWHPKFKSPAN